MSKGASKTTSKLSSNRVFIKVVRLFIILFFLLLLVYIGFRIFSLTQESVENGDRIVYETPTPVPYKPSRPSAYAEDELILILEEKIQVLEREISGISIRESVLTPPILDFDIDFGK